MLEVIHDAGSGNTYTNETFAISPADVATFGACAGRGLLTLLLYEALSPHMQTTDSHSNCLNFLFMDLDSWQ